jgi:hypothetical protein
MAHGQTRSENWAIQWLCFPYYSTIHPRAPGFLSRIQFLIVLIIGFPSKDYGLNNEKKETQLSFI